MTPDTPETRSLGDYLGVIRARRWLILAVMLVAVAVGLAYSLLKAPVYEATATIDFRDVTAELPLITPGTGVVPELNQQQDAAANTEIVTRDDVVRRVKRTSDTGMSPSELRGRVTATVDPNSNLVQVDVSTGDANLSAELANAFAEQTQVAARQDIRKSLARDAAQFNKALEDASLDPGTRSAYQTAAGRLETLSKVADPVDITRPASVPGSAASPKPVRDVTLAAVVGLILGIAAAFLRNTLDRRIKDSHEIQHELGLPLVGYVRAETLGLTGLGRNGGASTSDDDLEAFRILRTNVNFLAPDSGLRSIVVTSALPEEGKSTVAAGYAHANALAGKRTLLVECDMRRPVLAARFGVKGSPGLSDYLAGDASPREVIQRVSVPGLDAVNFLPLITAGESVYHPTEMIASERFKNFVDKTARAYDMVIFDSAPLLPVGDTLELIPQVDGVLLCVRLGQTTYDQALAAQQAMLHLPDRPTGLVITGVKRGSSDDYYGYYSYAAPSTASAAN